MHIKRLYIGDFGILRNQTLEQLAPGLVVVGGCNRAGKTTFMKVLKHLGYGFPKSGLPPASVRYQAEADVVRGEINDLLHIRLDGQSEPVCTLSQSSGSANVPIKDIYPVDAFTYHNLFVISLEQLARIPEGLNSKEALQLHSVLLGAGLSDIAGIPQMESRFTKDAAAIGGQRGSKSVKGFSPYVKLIEDGVKRKKQALAQVEEYRVQQEKLAEIEQQLETLQMDLKLQQADYSVLELLKSNFDVFQEVDQAVAALEQHEGSSIAADFPLHNENSVQANYEQYKELESKWREQYDLLRGSLENKEAVVELIPLLMKNRSTLESFYSRLSGLRERWTQLNGLREKTKTELNTLLIRMKRLNPAWTEQDLKRIEGLTLELLEENKLMSAIARHRQMQDQLQQLEYRKDEIQSEAKRLKQQKAEWQTPAPAANLKTYLWISALSVVLGLAVFSFHQTVGLFLGLFGIAGSALFVFIKSLGQKEAALKQRELDSAITGCAGQITGMEERIHQQQRELDQLEDYLSSVRKDLDIEESAAPDSILEYYRALTDLQEKTIRLHIDRQEADAFSDKLSVELAEMVKVLGDLEICQGQFFSSEIQRLYPLSRLMSPDDRKNSQGSEIVKNWITPDHWQMLQAQFLRWYDRLQRAIRLDTLASDRKIAAKKLTELIGLQNQLDQPGGDRLDSGAASLEEMVETYLSFCKSRADFVALQQRMDTLLQGLNRAATADRLKNAVSLLKPHSDSDAGILAGFDGKQPALDYFFQRHSNYPTQGSLEKEVFEASSRIKGMEEQIERCKDDIQKTKNHLERLSLTSELEQAHEAIQKGRAGLYPAVRQYAVNKAAAWLCRDIKNRFMDKMRDELLKNADEILQELTSGDYQKITPGDNLLNPDFAFTLEDGSTQDGADFLSRGTKEQVFLAVRLGRIMDIKPALPIIIDDSFVNYDPLHLKQAVSVLSKLSSTHQIFLMTCHPYLINLIAETGTACQYWQLEKGQFSVSDGDSLMRYLQVSNVN